MGGGGEATMGGGSCLHAQVVGLPSSVCWMTSVLDSGVPADVFTSRSKELPNAETINKNKYTSYYQRLRTPGAAGKLLPLCPPNCGWLAIVCETGCWNGWSSSLFHQDSCRSLKLYNGWFQWRCQVPCGDEAHESYGSKWSIHIQRQCISSYQMVGTFSRGVATDSVPCLCDSSLGHLGCWPEWPFFGLAQQRSLAFFHSWPLVLIFRWLCS